MKMIIEAHLVDDEGQTERVELAAINRELTTDPLGMNLAEGKALRYWPQRSSIWLNGSAKALPARMRIANAVTQD